MAKSSRAANGLATESVWDYPRPPGVEPCTRRVKVLHEGQTIAESARALRVLETASPPTIYLPREDVAIELLQPTDGHTVCEWRGQASYFDVKHEGGRVECYLDDERVRPQAESFYGGWAIDEIVGPHKGEPGTDGW